MRLREKLIAAARRDAPSEVVPYAFEKRIMARLTRRSAPDAWAAWGAVLWRAVIPCCAIMLVVGAMGAVTAASSPDLAPDDTLESVLFAGLDSGPDIP